MSTTSTTTVTAQEIQSVLTDYKIHLTGDNSANEELIPTHAPAIAENPSNWPMNHRRVPDFRPIDRNRGVEERPNGSNPFEQGFLIVMFTGVVANAVSKNRGT